jgi:hypothetical protein
MYFQGSGLPATEEFYAGKGAYDDMRPFASGVDKEIVHGEGHKFGSPGIPVVTGQSSLSRRAKALEILG